MKEPSVSDAFKRLKKMSYKQFEDWLRAYGYANYESGILYGNENSASWFEDDIFDLLLEEGVPEETAIRIVERLVKGEER